MKVGDVLALECQNEGIYDLVELGDVEQPDEETERSNALVRDSALVGRHCAVCSKQACNHEDRQSYQHEIH